MDVVVFGQVKKLEQEVNDLQLQVSELRDQISAGGTSLIEIDESFAVPANSSLQKSILVGINNYEIRTLYGENVSNTNPCTVVIYDKAVLGFKVYESVKSTNTYDIVAIPMSDKDVTQKIHVEVVNNGNTDAVFQIKITVTSLK